MIRKLIIGASIAVVAACSGAVEASNKAEVAARSGAEPVMLRASDGVMVYGALYRAANPRATILLFHQAGSSKDEYRTIAPRLAAAGFDALAIDQRSGGDLFGPNKTAAHYRGHANYLGAKPDLLAAVDWAAARGHPVMVWGSSYSSALVFLVAAERAQVVRALLAFSPSEYLGAPNLVHNAARKLNIPVFVTSASSADEIAPAKSLYDAVPASPRSVRYVPAKGVHGSSTLIEARNRAGADANFAAVLAFLQKAAG